MSNLLKSNIYTVKSALLVECSKALRHRRSSEHFAIGGICSIITELLFATYYIEDANNCDEVYSDSAVVSRRINEEYRDTARTVIAYRNKFAHEFGSPEYYDLYNSVVGIMGDVVAMCHDIGGACMKSEREYLTEYFGFDSDSFYEEMVGVFNKYGPIGYKNIVAKLKRQETLKKTLESAGG